MTREIFHNTRSNGYIEVALVRNKKKIYQTVHRLVAEAFIPNPDNKPHIDHMDGRRDNNNVENLRWCTPKENANNPITRIRQSGAQVEQAKEKWRKGCFDMRRKPVVQYSLDGDFIKEWESSSSAARSFVSNQRRVNCVSSKIAKCCRGEAYRTEGSIWVFKGNEGSVPSIVEKNCTSKNIRLNVHFPDGTSKIYDSINKAAKDLGIQNKTIRATNYSRRLGVSWELLNTHTFYENRWGGHRKKSITNDNRKVLENLEVIRRYEMIRTELVK